MQIPTSDHEARGLMPGSGGGYFAVLFVDSLDEVAEELRARFAAMPWPARWGRVVAALDRVPGVASFYGVTSAPALAVVRDGALLAIEHDCDGGACETLTTWAEQQQARLYSL